MLLFLTFIIAIKLEFEGRLRSLDLFFDLGFFLRSDLRGPFHLFSIIIHIELEECSAVVWLLLVSLLGNFSYLRLLDELVAVEASGIILPSLVVSVI